MGPKFAHPIENQRRLNKSRLANPGESHKTHDPTGPTEPVANALNPIERRNSSFRFSLSGLEANRIVDQIFIIDAVGRESPRTVRMPPTDRPTDSFPYP